MNIFILTHFHFSFSLFIFTFNFQFTSFYLSIFEYFTNLHISNCPTPPLDLFWTDFFGQFFFCAETRFFQGKNMRYGPEGDTIHLTVAPRESVIFCLEEKAFSATPTNTTTTQNAGHNSRWQQHAGSNTLITSTNL